MDYVSILDSLWNKSSTESYSENQIYANYRGVKTKQIFDSADTIFLLEVIRGHLTLFSYDTYKRTFLLIIPALLQSLQQQIEYFTRRTGHIPIIVHI